MKSKQIIIDPTSRILYAAYYIKGLYEVFGKENVSFGKKPFKHLKRSEELYSFEHFFAFVFIEEMKETKFIIDFCDPPDISQNAYDWCDVYAKINFNKNESNTDLSKLVVIPPSFGINIWNLQQTVYHCLNNFLKVPFSLPTNLKKYLRDYYQQYKREPLESYVSPLTNSIKKEKSYVFMIGTLWKETDNATSTNEERKKFIETCKSIDSCQFEGGMYATKEHSNYANFKDIIFSEPYSITEYIEKTKESDLVFNTPAVHNCHGWKLAEFLAMGKPIISTKLSNELPRNLVNGKDIHIIENTNELKSSIETILNTPQYKQLLSKNAREYFTELMTPRSVIESIFNKAQLKH